MFDQSAHYPVREITWNAERARDTIRDISDDVMDQLNRSSSLPEHPMDDVDSKSDLYMGMTGVIWALIHLNRVQAIETRRDFSALLEVQLSENEKERVRRPHPENASYLGGALPILMLRFKLSGDRRIADQIFRLIEENNNQPVRELMWGIPGSMLCANFMYQLTSDNRWRDIFLLQAQRLLNDWEWVPNIGYLWSPDLYGGKHKYLGAVHGFAGNAIPLIEGRHLLGEARFNEISARIMQTTVNTATCDEVYANWIEIFDASDRARLPKRVQHCHGAPGIITALSKLPKGVDAPFDRLLEKGGELTWHAGPLKKGANLCHGTAGNGYAFLKLFQRTQNDLWLTRARVFAMNAIEQYYLAKELFHQGRYTLWTGDLGTAVYLWDCMTGEPNFPTIDIF